jgi:hypothetical protein
MDNPEKVKGQSRMDNPEKLKGQSRMANPEKLKEKSIMDNPEKLEHWVLKIQDEDKQSKIPTTIYAGYHQTIILITQ